MKVLAAIAVVVCAAPAARAAGPDLMVELAAADARCLVRDLPTVTATVECFFEAQRPILNQAAVTQDQRDALEGFFRTGIEEARRADARGEGIEVWWDRAIQRTEALREKLNLSHPQLKIPSWAAKPSAAQLNDAYPKEMIAKRETGSVALLCLARADGTVTACKVRQERPAGKGFGQAALGLMPVVRMHPMLVNGVPLDGALVIVPMEFRFNEPRRPVGAVGGAKGGR